MTSSDKVLTSLRPVLVSRPLSGWSRFTLTTSTRLKFFFRYTDLYGVVVNVSDLYGFVLYDLYWS